MNECHHESATIYADNGPTTAGTLSWCPECGALSVRSSRASPHAWKIPSARPVCTWTPDEDGIHHTSCGQAFQFEHDPPFEYVRFCLYCGKLARVETP